MKNTTKLASAALIAAISMGAVLPQVAKADSDSLTGKGKVEFTKSSSTSSSATNPSGGSNGGSNSGGNITDSSAGTTNTSPGEFGIDYVTNLDFEKHGIITSNANDETYWATTWVANDGETAVKNAHYIKFHDFRNTLDHTYEVSGEITRQFNTVLSPKPVEEGLELKGSTITYNNAHLIPDKGYEPTADLDLTPTAGLKASTVVKFGESTPVLTNTKPTGFNAQQFNTGYGSFALMWGTYNADKEVDTSATSVQLTIPRGSTNAVINEGRYTAEITWTMSETPAV
ncbi:hypothetical protein CI088_01560 [Enterococcus plantarum]|uniref:WxL domain-containing protein n=1 Tax=Enterococcus plantarum TaxID=1077675 RepID=A0A2W4BK73_9ENTE|nr:WxL domain-containing protein [Enterococcus plantarum]PZL77515.1 hypothetical protein CI088_01560 [Enterococcus plantarum]